MKKFFTLCLAFMLASLLNMNAADTYTLVGDFNSWNTSAEGYNFTYVEATDSYVLEDVTLKGEFKIVKNNSWSNPQFGSNGNDVPLDAAYIMWNTDAGNMKMIDGKEAVYNDCKLELKVLGAKNASLRITSSTSMQAAIDTRADVWCVAGTFSDNQWNDAYEMTDLGNGVYELWSTELPSEFKFKAKGNWDISLGMHKEIKNTPIMGFDNAVDNGGDNISLKTDKAYDLYRYTLTVRGWVASFRVDGYKEAVPSLTRVFYESFDQNEGSGGNDGAWKDSVANGEWNKAVFDEPGWTATNGYFANKCIKLGASKKLGSATTPALGVNGNAELRFKAGAWNGDATTINITINNGGTLSVSSVTLVNNAFTDYTISISDATPESTITFSAAQATKNRFFLDEVEVYTNSAELSAAGISLNGVMKDAETAYYHGSLANPTVTVTLPAGATYMDVEVDNSGYITESRKNQTSDCTIPFYNAGNYTVRVTAYGEGVYSVASKDIAIETVSNVYTFDELINKGEGAIGALNFMPTVVAHIGKYLYLEGYDSWEDIRTSALVYASLDKTYKKGDVLENFIATVTYYNGNPQLTPLTTSLGDPRGFVEPYVYEVEAGEAWKAFAEEANVNKYVRVKNAPVTANPDAVDGVTAYTKHLGVNMPEDLDKKYDVEGFINNFNGKIQIQPISFTAIEEEKIEPFTYTEIFPANNTEVTSLSEIKITFPYNVTYDAKVPMGVLVMDGENKITPTVAVEDNVATLTFDAFTAYGSKPSLMVMAGAFKEANSGVGCELIMANWSIPTPPVRNDYMPTSMNPADGSVVDELKNIAFYFDDANPELTDNGHEYAKDYITVKDASGNVVESNPFLKVASVKGGGWGILFQPNKGSNITTPGTYVITFAEGLFSDYQYYETYGKKGRVNPEFTITYTIKGAALAAPTVSPANGAEIESPSTITLTFAEAVTVNAEAGAITLVRNSDAAYDKQDAVVTISEDGLTATLTFKPVCPTYEPKWYVGETYTMSIPAGYFVATSGAANEALSYSWKLVAPKFNVTKTTPEVGEVEQLDVIKIYFSEKVYLNNSNPINILNEAGELATTATVKGMGAWVSEEVYESWIEATLAQPITTPGQYTLVVPEGLAKNVNWGEGAINAAANLTWTVVVPGPKDGFTYETITPDPSQEVSSIESVVVTFPADVTYDNSLVMLGVNAMTLMNTLTVTVEGNTVTFTPATPITAEGSYQLTWNEGAFTAANGAKCASATINYTVAKADPNTYNYELAADPANGSTLPALTTINFNDPSRATVAFLTDEAKNTSNWVVVEDAEGNMYNTTLDNTEGVTIFVEGATAPGTYSVYVPAKTFYDMMAFTKDGKYNYNPEMRLTYTVEGETVEDFTPVVNPTAGNVTVEQIKTTVLSFEYPIASFDGSNVGLRYQFGHQFGGPWYDYSATGTISEDKLSMTIVWDFAPTVGTTYTLKLPAGCIVLENGAKNRLTEVAYTVVAGPKDMAEFVVPAGINGYINYDETDVNAWAPEFPFTVSTTAYNTVAFAAELPSLPAGITAMEVIDENGEVIAVLNQDGVAPLADGEIYYVKGETTKEYVDGAELKFRFRFTHLGVSETIQFSYIIAGGNITSIADVELDGNVIVRGNDIIAPEGAAIFTVSGIRVPAEGLAPGVYVVVLGNQAVKVMVK